ncbi:MAG: hypothetical protein K1X65_09925 [Caldilineales bacterium]|nr:hypothetical protein [Caldilineales bacterium]MCW5860203.1 hypothetical protein [Caldilineales bacterium]
MASQSQSLAAARPGRSWLAPGGLGAEVENFRTALFAAPGGKFIEVDDGEGSERVEMFVE